VLATRVSGATGVTAQGIAVLRTDRGDLKRAGESGSLLLHFPIPDMKGGRKSLDGTRCVFFICGEGPPTCGGGLRGCRGGECGTTMDALVPRDTGTGSFAEEPGTETAALQPVTLIVVLLPGTLNVALLPRGSDADEPSVETDEPVPQRDQRDSAALLPTELQYAVEGVTVPCK